MLGQFEEARSLAEDASARLTEMDPTATDGDECLAHLAAYAGDFTEAVRRQRAAVDALESLGLSAYLSTEAPQLARWLCRLRRSSQRAAPRTA